MRIYYDSTPTESSPTWVRVSAVVQFPDITTRNNMHGLCIVILRDFEGALHADWSTRDLTRMLVTDDADAAVANCNIIFRGILINKKFHGTDLVLEIAGIAIELSRRSFGSDEIKNYILSEGFVKTVNASNRIDLQYPDPNTPGAYLDFTWAVDQWIMDKDVGFMIKDTSAGYDTQIWDAADPLVLIDSTGRAVETGDFEDTHDFKTNEYTLKLSPAFGFGDGSASLYLSSTTDGVVIANTNSIKSITIEWNFKLTQSVSGFLALLYSQATLQIYKNGVGWEDVPGAQITMNNGNGAYSSTWCEGVSIDDGGEGGEYVLTGTDAELQDYLEEVAGEYTQIYGLRFKFYNLWHADSNAYGKLWVDFIKATVQFNADDVQPVMYKITANGASYVECDDVVDWTAMGVTEDVDAFQIGENTKKIVGDIASYSGLDIEIIAPENWLKYMARKFKGQHCSDVLKTITDLEGSEWLEYYIDNKIKLIKKADFVDSGISITQADYDHDWEYEDQCNQIKYIYVWGKSSFDKENNITTNIFAKAVDTSVAGEASLQIIDDNIWTVPEAQIIADAKLALLKDKRPSIRIPLDGINADLQLGTYVNITLARPTVAAADYKIRMIQRKRLGITDIKTIVYAGFGETEWDEKIIKAINKATRLAQKSLSDKLTSSPYDVGIGGINWGDINGAEIAVEDIITAELVDGESIDQAIDDLITALINTDVWLKHAGDIMTGDLTFASGKDIILADNVADVFQIRVGAAGVYLCIHSTNGAEELRIGCEGTEIARFRNAEGDLLMEDGKVINSQDADLTFLLGRNKIGHGADFAYFGYRTFVHDQFAVRQTPAFLTFINAATGQTVDLGIAKVKKMSLSATALTMFVPIAMGTNKITGLGAPTENGNALRWENISNAVYDPDTWTGGLNVSTAPSKEQCRSVFVALTGAVFYQGTWTPDNTGYPSIAHGDAADPKIGDWWICDADGYHAAVGATPARWYEIGDWIIWNDTTTEWDILRNAQGDNILKVSPGDNIQVAIDEIESVGSGTLVLLPGTHSLTAPLTVNDVGVDIVIHGYGETSIVDLNGDRQAIAITNCKSCLLRDFKVDANDLTTEATYIVDINEVNDHPIKIERLHITGNGTKGYGIGLESNNVLIRECEIDNVYIGMGGATLFDFIFDSNYIHDVTNDGIVVGTDGIGTIVNNTIETADRGIDTDVRESVIANNRIMDITNSGIEVYSGSDNNSITGNVINACDAGIVISTGDHNAISGNSIFNCTTYGIRINTGSISNKLSGNRLHNNGTDLSDLGTGTIKFYTQAEVDALLPVIDLPTWAGLTAMTRDGAYYDIDLSGTYGANVLGVSIYIITEDAAAGLAVYLRPKGNANSIQHEHQVANVPSTGTYLVHTNTDGIFQYMCNGGLTSANYKILMVVKE